MVHAFALYQGFYLHILCQDRQPFCVPYIDVSVILYGGEYPVAKLRHFLYSTVFQNIQTSVRTDEQSLS